MSGCEGCWTSNKGQQQALQTIKQQAIEYAKQSGKSMAIYREGYEFGFIEAYTAFAGQYNVIEVVSGYNDTSVS